MGSLQDFLNYESSQSLTNFINTKDKTSAEFTSFSIRTKNFNYVNSKNRYLFREEFTPDQMFSTNLSVRKVKPTGIRDTYMFMAINLPPNQHSKYQNVRMSQFVCYCKNEPVLQPFLMDLDNNFFPDNNEECP